MTSRMVVSNSASDGTFIYMQIDLRRSNGAVSQEFLDKFNIRTSFEQDGKGMADHMWGYMFLDPGKIRIFFQKKTDTLRGHLCSVAGDKDVRIVKADQASICEIIFVEQKNRGLDDVGLAFFAAFSEDPDSSCSVIHAVFCEVAQLLYTNTGAKHGFENEAVSDMDDTLYAGVAVPVSDSVVIGCVDDFVNFIFTQGFREQRGLLDADIHMIKR